jgi:LysM repeat protein
MSKDARQALLGILTALLSVTVILGSVFLTLAEGGTPLAFGPTSTKTFNMEDMPTLAYLLPGELTLTAMAGIPPRTPTPTETVIQICAPSDWTPLEVQPGDTLQSLAQRYATTVEILKHNNCLSTDTIFEGKIIFVPPLLTPTFTLTRSPSPSATRVACGPPYGWVAYIIRPGDTLSRLSQVLGVSIPALQAANCMGNSNQLYAGKTLWVPFIPVFTPAPTLTPQIWLTPTPTITFETPTATNSVTPISTNTPTPTPTSTQTLEGSTPTPTPTATSAPPTDTPTPTATSAPPTLTPTPTPTEAPVPLASPTASTPNPEGRPGEPESPD